MRLHCGQRADQNLAAVVRVLLSVSKARAFEPVDDTGNRAGSKPRHLGVTVRNAEPERVWQSVQWQNHSLCWVGVCLVCDIAAVTVLLRSHLN
jgi:hypothetical protein